MLFLFRGLGASVAKMILWIITEDEASYKKESATETQNTLKILATDEKDKTQIKFKICVDHCLSVVNSNKT